MASGKYPAYLLAKYYDLILRAANGVDFPGVDQTRCEIHLMRMVAHSQIEREPYDISGLADALHRSLTSVYEQVHSMADDGRLNLELKGNRELVRISDEVTGATLPLVEKMLDDLIELGDELKDSTAV